MELSRPREYFITNNKKEHLFFDGGSRKNMRGIVIKACVNDMAKKVIPKAYQNKVKTWWHNKGGKRDLEGLLAKALPLPGSPLDEAQTISENSLRWHWKGTRRSCPNWLFTVMSNESYNQATHKARADKALSRFIVRTSIELGDLVFAFNQHNARGQNCVIPIWPGIKLPLEKIGTSETAVVLETRGGIPGLTDFIPRKNEGEWKQRIKKWRNFLKTTKID